MTELLTIGYGGKHPKDFFAEIEALQPCCVVDVRRDPYHAFLGCYTKSGLEQRISNYHWIGELGNKETGVPPKYVNEEVGFRKLERIMQMFGRVVLLCAEKNDDRCHRSYIKKRFVKICPFCGAENPKGQVFCVKCRARFIDSYG